MTWQPPDPKHGWRRTVDSAKIAVSYSIRSIIEVVTGGVIRYGKTFWSDQGTGFWLGVDADRKAKFHLGGSTHALLWDGTELKIRGNITADTGQLGDLTIAGTLTISPTGKLTWDSAAGTLTKDGIVLAMSNKGSARLTWLEADTNESVYIGAWRHTILGKYLRLENDADEAGLEARTELATSTEGYAAASVTLYAANNVNNARLTVSAGLEPYIDSTAPLDMGLNKITGLANADAGTDALNQQTADARYPLRSAGYTGSFDTNDIHTITVVDGIITAVA